MININGVIFLLVNSCDSVITQSRTAAKLNGSQLDTFESEETQKLK